MKEVTCMSEMLWAYEEYCEDCRWEGKSPKPYWAWIAGEE